MIDAILATDKAISDHVPVVVRSAYHYCSRPLRFHVVTRGLSGEDFTGIMDKCPGVEMLQYQADGLDHGEVKLGAWVSISTMDRLRLPSILPEWVGKAIYLDIDTVVMDDLALMIELPVGECGLSAKLSTRKRFWMGSDFARQGRVDADKLVGLAGGDWRNFNAGVLLMDLNRFRENGYERITGGFVEATGCNDQIALVMYSKGRHAILPDRWNAWVGVDHHLPETKPYGVLHYVGSKKPWDTPSKAMYAAWKRWSDGEPPAQAVEAPVERTSSLEERAESAKTKRRESLGLRRAAWEKARAGPRA